ncbi:hypothetical protein SeMB42_g02483 [Synchytrium endobioticum]|uniref:Uncharacterized protein n=1 Tax=Synchytrium endobioticum TaxID=286115 RepID=A0A507DFU4_9FUNG|nr:hypothetical protein SeMB42_g02483 [Synchytrium endobioticum]
MVILIVVFVVHQIQAAGKDDNATMRQISKRLKSKREGLTTKPVDHINTSYLAMILRQGQTYIPAGSPLKLGQLSLNPDPGNSIEWQTYVMEYNAYRFELYQCYHVLVSKRLAELLADDRRGYIYDKKKNALEKHSGTLKHLLRVCLLLEAKHAIFSDCEAPHIRMIVSTQGGDLALPIHELRDERLSLADCINAMNANEILVSLENATDDSVLERKSPPPSMDDLPMAPTSHMSCAELHYIMEYYGLMFMKYQFKSVQLTKVLDNVLTPPICRPELENKQQQVIAEMKTYFYAACEYAEKLTERALDFLGYVEDGPPSSDLMDVSGVGNDVYNYEGNAPAASSVSVQPEGSDELDFDADLKREDWDMVLPLLEAPDPNVPQLLSYQEYPLVVDNQASTEPHYFDPYLSHEYDFNQQTIYESSAAFAAGGSELSQLNEAEIMWSAPVYRPIPDANEASSSREGQYYSFGPTPGQGSAGISPGPQHYSNEQQYRLDRHP